MADSLADRRWLAKKVAVQQSIIATQNERVRLAQLRYQNGAASFLEVLDAERDQFAAEQAMVQTRRALLASAWSTCMPRWVAARAMNRRPFRTTRRTGT